MPELPEVEVLARHLRPALLGRVVHAVTVQRTKVLQPTSATQLGRALRGAKFTKLSRRGKYLVFELKHPQEKSLLQVVGHLGMTGRMYLISRSARPPRHAAVVLDLGREQFVYEDQRYFGRFTLETSAVARLGPEPLSEDFTVAIFAAGLARSRQAIKVKLLDQSLVAGVGNIYASEALFRARIAPQTPAHRLSRPQVRQLRAAIRKVLADAIRFGSTIPLKHTGEAGDGLFYFGKAEGTSDYYEERLRVYDRRGQPCSHCGTAIKRIVQAARSTFYCPQCQTRARRRTG
jgi:formamidopyrimidine-DNA glycosylase